MQHTDIEMLRPPVAIAVSAGAARERALSSVFASMFLSDRSVIFLNVCWLSG
jgi:hypothetical protein